MKLLLDSHVVFWLMLEEPKLSNAAVTLLSSSEHSFFVSPVSHWEMAIKISTGKFQHAVDFESLWRTVFELFELSPIRMQHSEILTTLPFHHRDPFDRMLVAQCLADDLTLLSSDAVLDAYGIKRLW